jgi:hypothetical protein
MPATALSNLADSTVATAPDPAASGVSLVVAAGEGARFPAPVSEGSFYATVCPAGVSAGRGNSEIILVTARSTDTFTFIRAQGGTTARTIVVGDQVFNGLTKEVLDYRRRLSYAALWSVGVR